MTRLLGLALAAMAATASLAQAGDANDMIRQTVTVAYGDLDLSTDAGAHAMLARLKQAAVKACGGPAAFNSLYGIAPDYVNRVYGECRSAAVARAIASLHAPLLSALYAQSETPLNQYAGK